MTQRDLDFLRSWFSDYTISFYSTDPEEQKNISLKVDHTFQVCAIIARIAEEQPLSRDKIPLAETVGLFHDIGRFPQYARYKTFRDSISINHGKLGADVLTEGAVLRNLREDEQGLVINAVKFHNAFTIPDIGNPEHIHFLKLIRDADKLDIWRIFLGFFEGSELDRASEAGLGLPDSPGYSKEVIACIYNKRSASHASLKTLNDFKLMQLSWVYDLNFMTSVGLLLERDYIGRITRLLPQTDEIVGVSALLNEFAHQRLKAGPPCGVNR